MACLWRMCVCVCAWLFGRVCVCVHTTKQPSASMKEWTTLSENKTVSEPETAAPTAPPQLVLIRKRSQSLTNGLSDTGRKTAVANGSTGNHKSMSADLHLRRVPSPDQALNVPRIIVISPTSEDCLVKHEESVTQGGSVGVVEDEDSLEDNDVVWEMSSSTLSKNSLYGFLFLIQSINCFVGTMYVFMQESIFMLRYTVRCFAWSDLLWPFNSSSDCLCDNFVCFWGYWPVTGCVV